MSYMYEAYSESKYRFAVKKSSKVSYKILMLSDSTSFKLFFHIFAAIIEALIVGHKFLYTLLIVHGRLQCKPHPHCIFQVIVVIKSLAAQELL